MSHPFFTAIGRTFRNKHAGRIPWIRLARTLHEKGLLPDFVMEQLPEEEVIPKEAVPPPVPLEAVMPAPLVKEEVPTPEFLPKQILEGERTSESPSR